MCPQRVISKTDCALTKDLRPGMRPDNMISAVSWLAQAVNLGAVSAWNGVGGEGSHPFGPRGAAIMSTFPGLAELNPFN